MSCSWCGASQEAPLTPVEGKRLCWDCTEIYLDLAVARAKLAPITVLAADYRGLTVRHRAGRKT